MTKIAAIEDQNIGKITEDIEIDHPSDGIETPIRSDRRIAEISIPKPIDRGGSE